MFFSIFLKVLQLFDQSKTCYIKKGLSFVADKIDLNNDKI